jgi:ribosome-binding factor A
VNESRRVQKVERELQHIVATYILQGFKGRLHGLVTVSRVESNPKLRTAKVFVSVLGSEEDQKKSIQSLQDGIREIQQQVNKSVHMKFVPRISIVLDHGLERLLKVENLLNEISKTVRKDDDEDAPAENDENE